MQKRNLKRSLPLSCYVCYHRLLTKRGSPKKSHRKKKEKRKKKERKTEDIFIQMLLNQLLRRRRIQTRKFEGRVTDKIIKIKTNYNVHVPRFSFIAKVNQD